MPKNIIIDTDPGIDDAFALAYAFREPRLNIVGITTVSGNNGIDKVTRNALRLVKFFDQDIDVYEGESKPYAKEPSRGGDCHGDDGLGGAGQGLAYGDLAQGHGVDFIIDRARELDDLVLVTLGPLTNIARAIDKDPEAMARVKEIVSMGGGVERGNTTDYAEFNYWADPEAAKIVFDFSIPITMVGLNATDKSFFSSQEFERMAGYGEAGRLFFEMQKVYSGHYKNWYGIDGCRIHDLLAMVIASEDIGQGRRAQVDIVLDGPRAGESKAEFREDGQVYIVEDVDEKRYKELFYDRLFKEYI